MKLRCKTIIASSPIEKDTLHSSKCNKKTASTAATSGDQTTVARRSLGKKVDEDLIAMRVNCRS
jgi:hypothetical protein